MKKLLSIIVTIIVLLSAYIFVSRIKTNIALKNGVEDASILENKAEAFFLKKYLIAERGYYGDSKIGKPACSFRSYGYDAGHVYGEGFCQTLSQDEEMGLSMTKGWINAIRFRYIDTPQHPIIVWQKPADSICPKCGGTKVEDIFSEKYLKILDEKNEETNKILQKENFEKMLVGVPLTDELRAFMLQS